MSLVVTTKRCAASSGWRVDSNRITAVSVLVAVVVAISPELAHAQGLAVGAPSSVVTAEPFDMGASTIRMLGGFLFCLGLFGAGIHIYKKYCGPAGPSSKRRLKILERMPINQKNSLLLVSLDGNEILISSGPDKVQLLTPQRKHEIGIFDGDLDEACTLPKEGISCAV